MQKKEQNKSKIINAKHKKGFKILDKKQAYRLIQSICDINEKQWNKDVFGDIKQIKSCMVCPSTDDVKRYKTNIDGTFYANGGDGYVEYCKKHAKEHGYTDEHLHKTHK